MSIPHARRLPIPDVFKDASLSMMAKENNIVVSSTVQPSPGLLPSPPIILPSSRRNDILPAPSEKRVKYVPFTRGSTINKKKGLGFVRPKSPVPPALPPSPSTTITTNSSFDDQNVNVFSFRPDSPIGNSPVHTLATSAGEDLTLVAFNTPLSCSGVLKEKTNTSLSPSSPVVVHDGKTSGGLPFLKDTEEEHVLTAISTSIDGEMNMNAKTAHLETAASLRSIRSTLNQLKKKRSESRSRQSRPTHAKDIFFVHKNETFTNSDGVSHVPNKTAETISDMITQLVNVVRHRIICSSQNHREFMTKWSEVEMKTYHGRWEKLLHIKKSSKATTRFHQIPWPVLPSLVITSPSPDVITRTNVTRFLLRPYHDRDRESSSSSLEKIFGEIERWNDYQVMDSIMSNVREEDKQDVEMAWSKVVLVLMEMRGECMAGRSLF
ncbi:hypothetical protein Clacol_004315 [Clathrus columnatus]|uniref:Uncharacterized protein n=1 Tax=Clathrus columnatus TaxID=1419009 RepID=A0AAV5ABJ8_9AGAM|nr:hypothetical protein Clacol_004315 [Clathrus columnatus]